MGKAKYNFDKKINRKNTNSVKWDLLKLKFRTEDILPMWVADMDFEIPPCVQEAIQERSQHPVLGYTFRDDSYYRSIINWNERRHNWLIKKTHILFSPGVVPAINMAVSAYTRPGDKIIIQPPVYFPFKSAVLENGRQLKENKLKTVNNRFTFDLEDLKKQIDKRTKMLILSNPHNPGGTVWTKTELTQLAQICSDNNVMVVSDEIHCDLVFKAHEFTPFAKAAEKTGCKYISTIAPSKTFNLAGLSTSSVIIPDAELRDAFTSVSETLHITGGNIFGKVASEAAYRQGEAWLNQMLDYVNRNIDYVEDFIKNNFPQIKMMRPEATYLVWLDFRELGLNPKELQEFLIEKARLGLNAGHTFGPGGEGFARINLACPRSTAEEGMDRLKKALK